MQDVKVVREVCEYCEAYYHPVFAKHGYLQNASLNQSSYGEAQGDLHQRNSSEQKCFKDDSIYDEYCENRNNELPIGSQNKLTLIIIKQLRPESHGHGEL